LDYKSNRTSLCLDCICLRILAVRTQKDRANLMETIERKCREERWYTIRKVFTKEKVTISNLLKDFRRKNLTLIDLGVNYIMLFRIVQESLKERAKALKKESETIKLPEKKITSK